MKRLYAAELIWKAGEESGIFGKLPDTARLAKFLACFDALKDKADPEAWREENLKKQAAGVKFQRKSCGEWLHPINMFDFSGKKEDYREVPQDDPLAPTSEDGHDCEGFPGGCNRFGCPGGDKCYMLNNQTPHAAERALWKAQREAGTNEIWQERLLEGIMLWDDLRFEPAWRPEWEYRVKPMKLTAAIVRKGRNWNGIQNWQFTGTREEYRAKCEKYGYAILSNIKEVVEKPKTVKYYMAMIKYPNGGCLTSWVEYNKEKIITDAKCYACTIIGDIEEREIEA